MPINEILAPVYIKGKYVTPQYAPGHAFRLYFISGASWTTGVSGDTDNWRLQVAGTPVDSVEHIVHETFVRSAGLLPTGTVVSEIELWQAVTDAPNELVHINPLPSGNSYGTATGIAAAYTMYVFEAALRQKWRWTLFDSGDARPQRYAPATVPDDDDNSIFWWLLKGNVPFATNDGLRLTSEVSANTGYNRKLARSYGRTIAP